MSTIAGLLLLVVIAALGFGLFHVRRLSVKATAREQRLARRKIREREWEQMVEGIDQARDPGERRRGDRRSAAGPVLPPEIERRSADRRVSEDDREIRPGTTGEDPIPGERG